MCIGFLTGNLLKKSKDGTLGVQVPRAKLTIAFSKTVIQTAKYLVDVLTAATASHFDIVNSMLNIWR